MTSCKFASYGCSGGSYYCCRAARVLKLTHIRLDRESLTAIDNLDCLGPVTNLYLQQVGGYLFVVV